MNDVNDFYKIHETIWNQNLFRDTEVIAWNPLTSEASDVKVILVEPKDPKMEFGIQKMYKDQYPEFICMEEEVEIQVTCIRSRKEGEIRKKPIKISRES